MTEHDEIKTPGVPSLIKPRAALESAAKTTAVVVDPQRKRLTPKITNFICQRSARRVAK